MRASGGMQSLHQRIGDLHGELLLDLQPSGKYINNTGHFRKPDHFALWNVGDVRLSNKRQKVMLTQRIKLDVFDKNDLTCIGLVDRIVNDVVQILSIPVGQKLQCTRRSIRSPL